MPTYDYRCEACGHEFQVEQRISEEPINKCPSCGKKKADRMISQSKNGFILKGAGWYKDLYHKPSSTPAKADTTTPSVPAPSAPTKSETPAPAPTTKKAD